MKASHNSRSECLTARWTSGVQFPAVHVFISPKPTLGRLQPPQRWVMGLTSPKMRHCESTHLSLARSSRVLGLSTVHFYKHMSRSHISKRWMHYAATDAEEMPTKTRHFLLYTSSLIRWAKTSKTGTGALSESRNGVL